MLMKCKSKAPNTLKCHRHEVKAPPTAIYTGPSALLCPCRPRAAQQYTKGQVPFSALAGREPHGNIQRAKCPSLPLPAASPAAIYTGPSPLPCPCRPGAPPQYTQGQVPSPAHAHALAARGRRTRISILIDSPVRIDIQAGFLPASGWRGPCAVAHAQLIGLPPAAGPARRPRPPALSISRPAHPRRAAGGRHVHTRMCTHARTRLHTRVRGRALAPVPPSRFGAWALRALGTGHWQ